MFSLHENFTGQIQNFRNDTSPQDSNTLLQNSNTFHHKQSHFLGNFSFYDFFLDFIFFYAQTLHKNASNLFQRIRHCKVRTRFIINKATFCVIFRFNDFSWILCCSQNTVHFSTSTRFNQFRPP